MSDAYASFESSAMGRVLSVSVNRKHLNVTATLYATSDERRDHMLVYATADLREKRQVRLVEATEGDRACLWLERASFDLTEDEFGQLAELLAEFEGPTELNR